MQNSKFLQRTSLSFCTKEERRKKDSLCPCLQISASGCVGAGLGVVVCLLMFAIMPSKLVTGDGG